MLENLGLRINSEHPYEIELEDGRVVIQDFAVEPLVRKVDVGAARARFEDAFAAVWRGDAENDGFNRLVLAAGLNWRQVAMLRGYCKFLLQTAVTFSQAYMEETLARYPLAAGCWSSCSRRASSRAATSRPIRRPAGRCAMT